MQRATSNSATVGKSNGFKVALFCLVFIFMTIQLFASFSKSRAIWSRYMTRWNSRLEVTCLLPSGWHRPINASMSLRQGREKKSITKCNSGGFRFHLLLRRVFQVESPPKTSEAFSKSMKSNDLNSTHYSMIQRVLIWSVHKNPDWMPACYPSIKLS